MAGAEAARNSPGRQAGALLIVERRDGEGDVDLSPNLRHPVETQNPSKGELSYGIVAKAVH